MSAFLSFSPSVFAFPLCIVTCSTHDLTSGWPNNLSRTLCAAGPVQSCRSILFLLLLCCEFPSLCRWKAKQLNGSPFKDLSTFIKLYCLPFTPFPLFTSHTLMVRITLISLHSALQCLWISIFFCPNFRVLSERESANHPHYWDGIFHSHIFMWPLFHL